MVRVSAISFDADGTLWDFDAVMRRTLRVVLDELVRRWPGPDTAALTVDEMIAIRNTVAARNDHDWSRLEEIRREAFAVTLQQIHVADVDAADELNELYLRHRFEDIELFDDVIECLDQLDGRYPIGLLSNGNSYPDRCGLDGRFAFTVFAHDHGIAKPDPRLFHIAAAEAGCPINELIHVGDGQADIEGAVAAGCRSVLIDRANQRLPHAAQANHVITDLRQLPGGLHSLGQH